MKLIQDVISGSQRALAKVLTLVENEDAAVPDILDQLYMHTGNARLIGITGPPGSGKSTLMGQVINQIRSSGLSVGILAVDPSSPFSGGAILGDRLRMADIIDDSGVFIRSLGTRGSLGGLSNAVYDCAKVMDASGKEVIIIETVGAGQSEVDIVKIADTTLVVCVPGLGDEIQMIKAGILEIGDIFVVNKADKPDADMVANDLAMMVNLRKNSYDSQWHPIVRQTSTRTGTGIAGLWDDLEKHWSFLTRSGELARRRKLRIEAEIIRIAKHRLLEGAMDSILKSGTWASWVDSASHHKTSPYRVAEKLMECIRRDP
ncbi:MAG: methylmalonyl Co-A mutase-associated GTPase MeaB [Desulfobacteraceae bacterium]|nr:methylmalonyl Co-A mutase-associated GTPase MeaB [Desulfobacteraceae bacterium]